MINDTTIIYYTANKENEIFEKKIRDKIIENSGGLPIISVSQKPIDFGHNICVGEQPVCDATAHRQLLIGLKEAKTKFVIAAEADCLYPPEYFKFIPPTEDNAYRYENIVLFFNWIGPRTKGLFWKKPYCEGAQICGREYWIKMVEWALRKVNGWEKKRPGLIFRTGLEYSWTSENPVISCKTINGLRKWAGYIQGTNLNSLPYWGKADDLRKELFIN